MKGLGIGLAVAMLTGGGAAAFADEFAQEYQPPADPGWAAIAAHKDVHEDPAAPKINFGMKKVDKGPVLNARRQPKGVLSGKVVYTSGGHGWSYDSSTNWILGRPLVSGTEIVEDYGNIDQENLFALYCWNAGATVVPFRPIGWQNNEIVLDQDDAHVTYSGTWSMSSNTPFYSVPPDSESYRYADAVTGTETATARYAPPISQEGYYPVYTWVLDSSDRTNQLYRIRHAGGITECRVNHRNVGKGWVWLGTYYFRAGADEYVEVSNLKEDGDPGSVVIADAIRFGNGMGSVDRGGGVSKYPREAECSRYWAQISTGEPAATSVYDRVDLIDSDDNVGTPPRFAAYMNNENLSGVTDCIYIGFHTNAGGGRGADGLYNVSPSYRPPYQLELADFIGREVNEDMRQLDTVEFPAYPEWTNKTTHTYTRINYGEQRSDYINNEMSASINEVAYHDDLDDAKYINDPRARMYMARATMQGVIRFFHSLGAGDLAMPPDEPQHLSARRATNGNLLLSWDPPGMMTSAYSTTSGNVGGDAPTSYAIYISSDGLDFSFVKETSDDSTMATVSNPGFRGPAYVYVTSVNAAGESFPSNVAGCWRTNGYDKRVLIVDDYTRFDNQTPPIQSVPTRGNIRRPIPRYSNDFNYVVSFGQAIADSTHTLGFDSCAEYSLAIGNISLAQYDIVMWYCGQDAESQETLSATDQSLLADFLNDGGALFISGSNIGRDLSSLGSTEDKAFYSNVLGAALVADTVSTHSATGLAGTRFENAVFFPGTSISGGYGATYVNGPYNVASPDRLSPVATVSTTAFRYSASLGEAGVARRSNHGSVVYIGVPFEGITEAAARGATMDAVLGYLLGDPGGWMMY